MREDEKRRIIILNIIQKKKKIYRNCIKREFKFQKNNAH